MQSLVARLQELLKLPCGWDSYGASKVSLECVLGAANWFGRLSSHREASAPSAVPLADGGVQLEWHAGGRSLEVVFRPVAEPTFYYYDQQSGEEVEGVLRPEAGACEETIARWICSMR